MPHMTANRQRERKSGSGVRQPRQGRSLILLPCALKENAPKLNWCGLSFEIIGTDLSHRGAWKRPNPVGYYSQFEVQRGLPVQIASEIFHPAW